MKPVLMCLAAILLCIGMGGCALILTGTHQRMPIASKTPQAVVWLNGKPVDTAPCIVKLKRSYDIKPILEIRKEGYQTQKPELKIRFNEVATLNFLFPWNWLIDGFSGATVRYKQIDTVVLKPQ
jgi:hypothetical protein